MANVQKYAASATGHLTAHYERRKIMDPETGKMEYVKFGNQEIDPSRTHLNYNLAPEREGGQIAFIQQRTTEARTLKRDDVKVLCSWVVTLPRQDEYGEVRTYEDHEIREFFQESYKVLSDRYKEKNVVSAYVHMDETTPHMHFAFVPVTQDKKRGGEKVSAKEVVTKLDLQTFHVDLQKHMDERFGDGYFPILNGNTEGGNRTIVEMKTEKATTDLTVVNEEVFRAQLLLEELRKSVEEEEERLLTKQQAVYTEADRLQSISDKVSEATQKLSEVQKALQPIEAQRTALEGSVASLEGQKEELQKNIYEAAIELQAVDVAIKEKKEAGSRLFTSHEDMNRAISRAKAEAERESRIKVLESRVRLFEAFLQWAPATVKQLWQQFQQLLRRKQDKTQEQNRPQKKEKDISD